jgi:hypothetical protein
MAEEYEQFNAHQEDVRRRADSLVRAIFVLAGGALTVSIGFFGGSSRSLLSQDLIPILQASWWGLFVSILSLASSLVVVIGRDYAFGERWRAKLYGNRQDAPNDPGWCELLIWILAVVGFIGFILGMVGLAYVASASVSNA